MTEEQRQKQMRKKAEEPFEVQSYARVGWTPEEIVHAAGLYGLTWTVSEATKFLRANEATLEDVMLTAGLLVISKALKEAMASVE